MDNCSSLESDRAQAPGVRIPPVPPCDVARHRGQPGLHQGSLVPKASAGTRAPASLEWQSHFESLGVIHTPVVDREYRSVLTFEDPDRIQFELFYLDPQFEAATTPH